MIVLGRHRYPLLATRLARSSEDEVTYPEVGLTRSATMPPGYRHDRLRLQVGTGEIAWERAKDAIRRWKARAHAGITITPPDDPVLEGTTVLASRAFGPVTILACRVVSWTDEPTRFGLAYGTLPGHPETGEEAFHVVLCDDDTVTAEILTFSRPDDLPTKIAGPIARKIQEAATRRNRAVRR